jgi:hypothetical protein
MSDAKADFLQAIRVPGAEVDYDPAWFSRVVPTIPDLPTATDAESAVLAIKAFYDNFNKLLQMFQGVPLLDFLLRGGQRNDALIGLLMTSLSYTGAVGEMTIISPVEGGLYWGAFGAYEVSFTGGDPALVTYDLNGKTFGTMTKHDGRWTDGYFTPVGDYRMTIRATFATRTVEKTVNFKVDSVLNMVTIPEDGATIKDRTIPEFSISTGSATNIKSVEVKIDGKTIAQLEKEDDLYRSVTPFIFVSGETYNAVCSFVVQTVAQEIFTKTIKLIILAL